MSDPVPHDTPRAWGPRRALDELCDELGVQPAYEAGGETRRAPDESVRHVLRELGAPLPDRDGDLEADTAALRTLRLERWRRMLEPVTVAWTGDAPAVAMRIEGEAEPTDLVLRLEHEDGAAAERRIDPGELRWLERTSLEGTVFRRGLIPLPPDLAEGWHDVTVAVAGREAGTRLVRAPRTTWDGPAEEAVGDARRWRAWGAFLPLYALRSTRDRGVGDLTDLGALADWTAGQGGSFVATLPLMAAFLGGGARGEPIEVGPYGPVSRLFWNELYLDVERAPGLERVPAARRVLDSPGHRERVATLRSRDHADPLAAMAAKREVLEPLVAALDDAGLRPALDAFAHRRDDAVDYARFRAFGEVVGAPWRAWPERPRAGELADVDLPAERVDYHLYVQWAFERQLAGLAAGEHGASLYLDLPLGCHPDGYDVWRHRGVFAHGASGGAPPDALAGEGQDWGFPPLHPLRSREDGHAYLRAALRTLMRVSGMVRLDHVMSLHRLFWVPAGGGAADGVYVRYPAEELWALLCLESRRHRCEVVGEDLGTVPPDVPAAMERHRARRMWVLPFEERPPAARTVASLNTHDLPSFAAWWRERRASGAEPDLPDEPPVAATLERIAASAARLVLVNLEDLWLEEEPQNVPGTSGGGNWTRRARLDLEAMRSDARVADALARVDRARDGPRADRPIDGPTPAANDEAPRDPHPQLPWPT
jgi:4-alpha-glucanotransferase